MDLLENSSLPLKPHVLRLQPGQDLKSELQAYCNRLSIRAGFVISCTGSLKQLKIRLANSTSYFEKSEGFEILSLQGSLSLNGLHLHMSVADEKGTCWGGHLMDGCQIYTTAEILLVELSDFSFTRKHDPSTGFAELVVGPR